MSNHLRKSGEFGEAQTGSAVGNPEPSRGYTLGRCRDYRRGSDLLMTGKSARHPSRDDEIVRSVEKSAGNRTLHLSTDGTDEYTGTAYITQVAVTTPHDGIIGVTFNFQGSGALTCTLS